MVQEHQGKRESQWKVIASIAAKFDWRYGGDVR
jgi:hypothetical protein